MLLLPQTVMIKWHNSYKKFYIDKGYLYTKVGDDFEINVSDLFPKSNQNVKVICDYCKQTYLKVNSERKDSSDCCNNCKGRKIGKSKIKYTYNDIVIEFQNRNFILLEAEYRGYGVHHKYICENGHETSITVKNLLKGRGCAECRNIKIGTDKRFSLDEVREMFERENCILLSGEYINSKQKLKYKCSCGNIDEKDLTHFVRGQRCAYCKSIKLREANLNLNLTDEDRENRRHIEGYIEWRLLVFKRDNYTCRVCGGSVNLNAHHLNGYHWCKELRIDVANGITLCKECHMSNEQSFHRVYGNKNNTIYQFLNWYKNYYDSDFELKILGESSETLFYFADEMAKMSI